MAEVDLFGENQTPSFGTRGFRQVSYHYNAEGDLQSVSGDTLPVSYTYDSLYRVKTMQEGSQLPTTYAYDLSGNLTSITYPGGEEEQFTSYDADGNLLTEIDPNGVRRTYVRTLDGGTIDPSEVWEVDYSNIPSGETQLTKINYFYDGFERLTNVTDDSGARQYVLDDLGNPTEVDVAFDHSGNWWHTLNYSYNPAGSESKLVLDRNGVLPPTLTYGYDGLGQVIKQTVPGFGPGSIGTNSSPVQDTYEYAYDGDGRLTSVGKPVVPFFINGPPVPAIVTNYAYDARGELTSLTNSLTGANYLTTPPSNLLLSSFSGMTYDAAGSRLTDNALIDLNLANGWLFDPYIIQPTNNLTGMAVQPFNLSYSYDNLDELTGENSSAFGVIEAAGSLPPILANNYGYSFSYDTAGNPLQTRYNPNTIPVSGSNWTFNNNNQFTNSGFTYDHNGNPTTYGNTALTFDPEDEMTAMPYTYNGQSGSFDAMYDSEGHREWKDGAGGRTYYVYDGDDPVFEFSNSNLTVNAFGPAGLMARYTSNPPDINEASAGIQPWQEYYTFDPQGNVVQRLMGSADTFGTTNSVANPTFFPDGALPIDTEYFDAFGQKRWDIDIYTGQGETYQSDPFGFGGQYGYYTDPETGMVLMTHRYYDPDTARFLTRDPTGYAGGLNLYGFVGNNPLTNADPSGFDVDGEPLNPFESDDFLPKPGEGLPPGDYGVDNGPMTMYEDEWALRNQAENGNPDRPPVPALPAAKPLAPAPQALMKRGPKLWPDGPHNQTIQRRIGEVQEENPDWEHVGGGNLTEQVVPIPPGGYKGVRRPDITFKQPDGSFYNEQVGKIDGSGNPVLREQKALSDLGAALGKTPKFTPYNKVPGYKNLPGLPPMPTIPGAPNP